MAVFNNSSKKPTDERRQGNESGLSIVAEGMILQGDVVSDGDLRVEGRINGHLVCKSKLVIGKKGHVDGNIDAANATIEGNVRGKLVVRNLLQLQENGKVEGDILTEKMVVQAGAVFTGNCKMGKEGQELLKATPVPNLLKMHKDGGGKAKNGEIKQEPAKAV